MATKPTLSREYLFLPMTDMNFDVLDLDVHQVAFVTEGTEPTETDWLEALVVDDQHELYDPDIGEAIAVLIGPERDDDVTTEDLEEGDYQTWIDVSVPLSDERVVRVAGTTTISQTGV